ncbi:hypothetical protein C7M52_01533 [Mixta theicola]|nr:hypothetical protein C7M52_01533 [Mixta theicola]
MTGRRFPDATSLLPAGARPVFFIVDGKNAKAANSRKAMGCDKRGRCGPARFAYCFMLPTISSGRTQASNSSSVR